MVGNGERMSRPNSLGLEAPSGEKEPLHFDVQLVGAPPEVEQLVNSIKQVAEDFLYHWKTFSIVLPPSRFAGPGNRLSDIIVPPSCDEFDSVALEAIEPQPLSPKQLHSIMEKGEFEVPSRLYPGQVQVWRVAGWLQMGRARARDALCRQVAFAAALIVVVARDRLLRDRPFSAVAGVKALLKGLYRLLDLAIGLPSMEARDLDKKIRDERSRYLVAELICKPEHEQDLQALASWLRGALAGSAGAPPPVLCYYTTPQNTQIDLRLYRREILRKAAPTLQAILERESRGWFLHFRERRAAMLASQKVPMKDIEEEIREAAIREYVSRICAAIMSSEALAALGKDVPSLLADQLRAYNDLERAQEAVRRSLEAGVAAVEARLRAEHPILARAHIWRSEKLNEAAQRLSSELRWTAMEDAAARMAAHRLHQHRYFLLRDLAFLREREPLLLKELRAAKTPRKVFEWRTRIWFPQNYIVWRHNRGKKERIPTVVSSVCSSQGWAGGGGGGAQFSLQRETVAASSGAAPPCPAHNVAHRTWSWSWNLMYVLIIYVPWLSPLSVRSLFCVKPYATDYELSQVDGTLYPKKSSEMPTMWSRLLRLWKYVSKHRNQFENTPDTGLLGRGLSRQANRIFNYGIIGGLGSLALLLLFPIAAIVTSSVCFVVGCTVPVWMPAVCLCVHVANAVIYEFDGQRDENRWFVLFQVLIWRIAILGILQPIAAILVALIICPLAALIIIVVGGLAWCIVRALQACAWRALLARGARVPAADCAYCRRVPAARARPPPPLTISSAQALAAICAHAELESLKIWASDMEKTIEKPLRDYRQFVQACFGPFSVQIAKTGPYKQLEKECSELTSSLREKVAARTSDLTLTLSDSVKSRIRMTAQDLRHTLQAGGSQLSRHWGSDLPEDWWAARALEPGDWTALAANTLVQVFDADVMWCVPASEPAAACGGAGAAWAALCPRDAPPPDVLQQDDCATRFGLWAGAGACRVAAPALDALAFCPRAHAQPPLPAPHLAALLLYNRDADSPIPLESDWCNEVLKALEDAPDADLIRDDEEMSRSGGGSSIASSTSDGVRREPSDSGSDAELAEPCVAPLCRVSPSRSRAACRWTLTGRGVRLRADLASPEDVNLDVDRSHVGTSV